MHTCDIVFPSVPLSPSGAFHLDYDDHEDSFSKADADSIISNHYIYWLICIQTYKRNRDAILSGWKLVYHDVETCIYLFGCNVIAGFRGTARAKDIYDDILLSFGKVFPRTEQAVIFLRQFMQLNPGIILELTGHSLGGAVAREAGRILSLRSITFNAAAPPSSPVFTTELSTDYHIVFDIISAWQHPNVIRIDKKFWPLPSTFGLVIPYFWLWHILDGIIGSHSLDNFSNRVKGNVITADIENNYLQRWFLSLPSTGRRYVLIFLFGAGQGVRTNLPSIR